MGQKLLTVVFVDVVSSTELLTTVGDQRGTAAIERTLVAVRERVEPYEGRLVKSLGDGLMLVFASPRSAVAFAIAVQQAAAGPLPLRVGMHFGEVVGADDPMGEAVHAAARITDRAGAGVVLVSDVVARLAGSMPGVRFVDRGRVRLKGFPNRWQLHGVVPAGEVGPPAPVFGRDVELDRIDAMIASVVLGSGQTLVIEGEAGIGKTHLAAVAAARAAPGGVVVALGGADELEQDRPGRILTAVASQLGGDPSDWALHAGQQPGGDPAYAVVEGFVDAVQDAAARRPLLIVVEDLHWADELSLRAIASLVRRIGPLALGVIATLRPTPRAPSLVRLLDVAASASGSSLVLDGLDPSAMAGLVASLTAAAPGPELRRRLAATAGNPLFATELVRALDDEGALHIENGVADTEVGSMPDGLVQTLARRVAALPTATGEVLRLASLLGGEFCLDDLAAVAGRSVVDVAAVLREAVESALVSGEGNRLAFRHDLVREAVYLGMPPAIRTDLHVAAARALAQAGATAADVARQYALGARPGDLVAVGWLVRAARDATRVDTATAVSLFDQAIALAPLDWPERIEAESRLAELLAWSGRVEDARRLAEAVLDRSLAPEEELVARRALGTVCSTAGELTAASEQLVAAARLADVPEVERAILGCAAAGMSVIAGGTPAEVAERTAGAHVGTTDPALACWVHNTLAVAAVCAGAYEQQLEHARIACTILDATHVAPLGFLIPQTWVPTAHYNLDQIDRAGATAREARRDGERRGDVGIVVHSASILAGLDYATGAWDEATSSVDAALVLGEETGVEAQMIFMRAIGALIAFGRGNRQMAAGHVAAAEAFYASGGHHPFGLDLLLVARAQLLGADDQTAAAAALLGAVWDQTVNLRGLIQWRDLGPDLIRWSRAVGDVDRAVAVAGDLEEMASRSPSTSGVLAALRGRALATDDADGMVAAAERSRLGARVVDTAGICEEAAVLLLDQGRTGEAVGLLDEAAALHEAMGAGGHLARIDARLRSAGARRRRSAPARASHGWESLSPKELEVVALVAEGYSNPQVAAQLYISRRTVETHLSHVFTKLGLANRTQLAAAAVDRELASPATGGDHLVG